MEQYIRCIIDLIKNRFNGEIDQERLLMGALKGIFGFVSDDRKAVDFNTIILEAVKGIFGNIDKYSTLIPRIIDEKSDCEDIGTNIPDNMTFYIKRDMGYIRINRFAKNTYESVCKTLDIIDGAGIRKIILDMRHNHGGDFKQAVLTAGKFVPEGLIATLKSKSSALKDIEYRSEMKELKYKLAVLVDEETASSAEVLAGAVQDTKSGVLIGTKTVGKASVLRMINILNYEGFIEARRLTGTDIVDADTLKAKYGFKTLNDEILGAAYITVGEYMTPGGRIINETGLSPDIYLDNSDKAKEIYIYRIHKLSKVSEYTINNESEDIYHAKAILKNAGYNVKKLNKKMDEITADAVEKFQSDKRLIVTGVLDMPTQDALNALLDAWVFQEDSQYAKAVEILDK